jgi:tetratricopeptide (TPR) repeat protein
MFQLKHLVVLIGIAASAPAAAQLGGDLQAQILYAYQTEDLNLLTGLVQTLTTAVKANGDKAAPRYHLAHAEYRLAQIAGERQPRRAEEALADCVAELKAIREHDSQATEALLLESVCLAELGKYRKIQGVLLRTLAAERLARADRLAPTNPRVMLVLAARSLERVESGAGDEAQALAQLQLAAERFEQTFGTNVEEPGWGHADAYLLLGEEYLRRGDLLAARNWIEKALITAPDYKAAQREFDLLARH